MTRLLFIPQRLKHGFRGLFLCEDGGGEVAVLVTVYENVTGGGHEAVLDAAVAGDCFLVCAGVEEADIKVLPAAADSGKEDGVGVIIGIIEVLAVAGEAAKEYALILIIPLIHRKKDEALVKAPGIRKAGHE